MENHASCEHADWFNSGGSREDDRHCLEGQNCCLPVKMVCGRCGAYIRLSAQNADIGTTLDVFHLKVKCPGCFTEHLFMPEEPAEEDEADDQQVLDFCKDVLADE